MLADLAASKLSTEKFPERIRMDPTAKATLKIVKMVFPIIATTLIMSFSRDITFFLSVYW